MNLEVTVPPFNMSIGDLIKGGAIITTERLTGFLCIALGYSLQNYRADYICRLTKIVSGNVTIFEAELHGRKYRGEAKAISNGMGLQLFSV